MRAAVWTAPLLVALLALPANAAPEALPAETTAVGPVRILMLDGCIHSRVEQQVGFSITAVPIEIDSSAMNLEICDIDPAKADIAIINLAKRIESERKAAARKKRPVPITIVYTGAFLQGSDVVNSWSKSLKRLVKTAVVISPGGNNSDLDASEIWPASKLAFKIGYGPGGAPTGSQGAAISIYADYGPPIPVNVDGSQYNAGGSSTAAMVVSAHLANVLSSGAGQKLSPAQLLKKLKDTFGQEVIAAADLEARFLAVLQ